MIVTHLNCVHKSHCEEYLKTVFSGYTLSTSGSGVYWKSRSLFLIIALSIVTSIVALEFSRSPSGVRQVMQVFDVLEQYHKLLNNINFT